MKKSIAMLKKMIKLYPQTESLLTSDEKRKVSESIKKEK
jgi:hypothetical protein